PRGGHQVPVGGEPVLPSQCNRRVVKPGPPSTGIVFGSGDRNHVFLLAVLRLDILTTILGKTRHFSRSGWRQSERVRCDHVEGSPISHFARAFALLAGYRDSSRR